MIKTSTFLSIPASALAFLLFFLPLLPVLAQGADTVYYNQDGKKLKAKLDPEADYYIVTTYSDTTQTLYSETENAFYIDGRKKSESHYTVDQSKEYKLRQQVSMDIRWHRNGQMAHKANYTDGKKVGEAFDYYQNGKIKRQEMFANEALVSGKCFTESGADTVYFPYLQQPLFRGGEPALVQFMIRNMRYPKVARKRGIEGLVIVQFVVNKTGEVTDMTLVRKVSPELDAESLRVVQLMSGKFQPARVEGNPCSFRYTLPVRFGLQ